MLSNIWPAAIASSSCPPPDLFGDTLNLFDHSSNHHIVFNANRNEECHRRKAIARFEHRSGALRLQRRECAMRGEYEVTASDGTTRHFSPGSLLLLEDTTGQGHATRILADALVFTVALPE